MLPTPELGPELFSVAPMMGHTNRHYRNYFGMISQRAWLYTEMIPASRIFQSFITAARQESGAGANNEELLDSNWVLEQTERIRYMHQTDNAFKSDETLDELLNPGPNDAVLQLGGRDPIQLANAAAIGAAFGYQAINLNCGCPSTSVSARATGAALMREPTVVASCLDAMSHQMDQINPSTILSVKHRLGVYDAHIYDPVSDHGKDDEEAYNICSSFVRSITAASKVSRIQVHARIALLGFDSLSGEKVRQENGVPLSNLWTPSNNFLSTKATGSDTELKKAGKVNHQRVQYQAKRRARQVTLQNRSVPPLRPKVVRQIAQDFPDLQVSSNGGIDTMEEIRERGVPSNDSPVAGAMIGRAAINHPCAFAAVDRELYGQDLLYATRRQVLTNYIGYCEHEERRLRESLGVKVMCRGGHPFQDGDSSSMEWQRRRLVAPAFHLFMGEYGNEPYQRRLRKLVGRACRHSAHSMLMAAMTEVPSTSLDKPLADHVPWKNIPQYDFIKRAGAMQRTIH